MNKRVIYGIIIVIVVFFIIVAVRFNFNSREDSWIRNEQGIWIKHGNPSITPSYVNSQKDAIACAFTLYGMAKNDGIIFDSQCLGICGDYAIDIVHNPRTDMDDIAQNQCEDYSKGRVTNFIELDKDENIIKVVD